MSGHLESALAAIGFASGDELVVSSSWARVKADLPVTVSNAILPGADGLWLRMQAHAQASAGESLLRLGLSATAPPDVRRHDHHLCHAVRSPASARRSATACVWSLTGKGRSEPRLYRLRRGPA